MMHAVRAQILLAAGVLAAVAAAGCGGDANPDAATTAGPHSDMQCTQCHTGPASSGFVAAVTSDACAACHSAADLRPRVEAKDVGFRHTEHPGETGGTLGCAACHTHDSGDADLSVATIGCFLCHANLPESDNADATIAVTTCTGCHVQPAHVAFTAGGESIDHAAVMTRNISCLLCHYDVAAGSGVAAPATCRTCHGVPGGPDALRGDESMDPAVVHTMHLDSAVELTCTRCHEPVDHRVVRLASALTLDCGSCHGQGDPALGAPLDSTIHRDVQELYVGLDPRHPELGPAVKFTARVACASCHSKASTSLPVGSAAQLRAMRQECDACHGGRFGRLLEPWVAGMTRNTRLAGDFVQAAAANTSVRQDAVADSMARAAVAVWRHIDRGDGVHNLPAADALLRGAIEAAARSYRRVGVAEPSRPGLGPDPSNVSCVRCHYGVQTVATPVDGRTFAHTDHVITGAIACARCHGTADLFEDDGTTFDPAHGTTGITQTDCMTCHHVDRAGECTACHAQVDIARLHPRADVTVHIRHNNAEHTREVDFSHASHVPVACTSCHQPGVAQVPASCNTCHEAHHGAAPTARGCDTCHGTDVLERHKRTDHLECGACHAPATLSLMGSADRRFCLVCHVSQTDHRPEGDCSTCHLALTPEQALRRIVAARTSQRRQ